MTRKQSLIVYGLLIFTLLVALYLMRVIGNYADCLISHRSGYLLLADREAVKEACKARVNPFFGF